MPVRRLMAEDVDVAAFSSNSLTSCSAYSAAVAGSGGPFFLEVDFFVVVVVVLAVAFFVASFLVPEAPPFFDAFTAELEGVVMLLVSFRTTGFPDLMGFEPSAIPSDAALNPAFEVVGIREISVQQGDGDASQSLVFQGTGSCVREKNRPVIDLEATGCRSLISAS